MSHLPSKYNLREKRKAALPQEEPVQKRRKTAAEYQREYRARQRQNPELYKTIREYENLRVQLYLANLSEEKKAQYREVTRKRVQRFRAKQASNGCNTTNRKKAKPAAKTREGKSQQRQKWAEAKRNYRAKQSSQAHRREKEKRRQKYAAKKALERARKEALERAKEPRTPVQSEGTTYSKGAIRKAVYRAERGMPKTSGQYAEVLTRLIQKSTPRKKERLKENGVITTPTSHKFLHFAGKSSARIREEFLQLNKKRNNTAMRRKRILAVALSVKTKYKKSGYGTCLQRQLGIGQALIKSASAVNSAEELSHRKQRQDAIGNEVVKLVEDFYDRGDISRDLPDARSAKKDGCLVKGRKVMDLTIRSAHSKFSSENPNVQISLSKFRQLRPKHVLTMASNQRAQCLCEYCTNIEFKLQSLTRFMALHQLGQSPVKDKHDASRATLCSKENGEYKKVCLDRKCSTCGVHLLEFPELANYQEKEVNWFRWQTKEFLYNGNSIKRMAKVPKHGTIKDLTNELKEELQPFSKHLFNASWQWRQYDAIAKDVPANWVVFCMDYAENYACAAQDEAQGAHWSNVQATIHPVVASYRCMEVDCSRMVTETIMFISDDLKHCYHGVQHFSQKAISYLQEEGVQFSKLIHFTDGAPTQYKNKVCFADASLSYKDNGFLTEKHFFGSRHGKGPCDREIGVLKKQATLQVNARQVEIDNAYHLFCFGRDRLSRPKSPNEHVHEKRHFIYVPCGEINRHRPECTDVKPLKGTQQIHCVCSTEEPYKIAARERSCFCDKCKAGRKDCSYSQLLGNWTFSNLQGNGKMTNTSKGRGQVQTTPSGGDINKAGVEETQSPKHSGLDMDHEVAGTSLGRGQVQTTPSSGDINEAGAEERQSPHHSGLDMDHEVAGTSLGRGQVQTTPSSGDINEAGAEERQSPHHSGLDIDHEVAGTSLGRGQVQTTPSSGDINEAGAEERQSPHHSGLDIDHEVSETSLGRGQVQTTPSSGDVNEAGAEEKLSPQHRGIKIQQEQYYAVYYDNEFYLGRLLDVKGDEFMFKFLHRLRSANQEMRIYDWPPRSDFERVQGRYIIGGPLKLMGSGPFSVEESELKCIDELYAEMKMRTVEM